MSEIEVETTIDSVLILTDSARIVRKGTVELKKGDYTLCIKTGTPYVREDSVLVKGTGKGSILDVQVEKRSEKREIASDLKKLKDELVKLEDELSSIDTEIKVLNERMNYMSTTMKKFSEIFPLGMVAGETNIETYSAMEEKFSKSILDMTKEKKKLERERKKVSDQISIVKSKIKNMEYGYKRDIDAILINISVTADSTFKIEVQYHVDNAYWSPRYDAVISEGKVLLKTYASIINGTKEDWQNVSLSVSTATSEKAEYVEPEPWYLDAYIPEPRVSRKKSFAPRPLAAPAPKSMAEEVGATMAEEYYEEAEEEEIEFITAEINTSGLGIIRYDVPGKVDLPYDKNPHPILLSEKELESERLYFWNADSKEEVIAQDEVKNDETPILAGPVKVFVDDEYIGETELDQVAPYEKFKIGTRASYEFKVKKELISRRSNVGGMTRGQYKNEYKYKLKIEYFGKEESKIVVMDCIPTSRHAKIKVELKESEPEPIENKVGVLKWILRIVPELKSEIIYDFVVEWDKDVVVTPSLP